LGFSLFLFSMLRHCTEGISMKTWLTCSWLLSRNAQCYRRKRTDLLVLNTVILGMTILLESVFDKNENHWSYLRCYNQFKTAEKIRYCGYWKSNRPLSSPHVIDSPDLLRK
jgi:hypothetical protein